VLNPQRLCFPLGRFFAKVMAMKRATVCLLLGLVPSLMPAATGYLVRNLISDQSGVADFTDPNLVNAWGIAISAASPFWVCDGGSGLSTVYSASASAFSVTATKAALPPSGNGGNKVCTGIVANGANTTFLVGPAPGRSASFIFATEGGTISGWANAVDPLNAQIAIDNSAAGAVYKGLAMVTTPTPLLFAANFKTGAIDVFDGTWKPVTMAAGAFTDPAIPAGFAPFNIQNLGGKLYVTYAKQSATKVFDAPGVGNGYVDVYDTSGKLLQHLAEKGTLNSPWGVQIAPATFGKLGGALLVGNFGDGLISAFDPTTGAFLGTLQDQTGKNIQIDGLWGLQFGNNGNGGDANSLYFAAGPSQQRHGLFGIIVSNPIITANVVNAGTPGAAIAPNTFASIQGGSLAPTTRTWAAKDFNGDNLPTSLDGVSVTVNGQPAYVYFVSPRQINFLTPANMAVGTPAQIVVNDGGLNSITMSVPTSGFGPAFFLLGGKYGAAIHADGKVVGPTTLVPNNSTPAKAGEQIAFYATGLGNTTPGVGNGVIVSTAAPTAALPTVLINGTQAQVTFAGLVATGLYQINAVVPANAPSGDNTLTVSIGGFTSPGGVLVAVQ
jgi:uncharacterized protein (TIGR03118 family)